MIGLAAANQLWWASAMLVVAVCYLQWGRRVRVDVSSLTLWDRSLRRRWWWARVRRPVSMLLACLFVAVLALALARPFSWSEWANARTLILLIDNSAGMNAPAGDSTRRAAARRRALAVIDSLTTADRAAVVSVSSTPVVHCGVTGDRTALRRAAAAIAPSDGVDHWTDVTNTMRRMAAGYRRSRLVAITDSPPEGVAALVGADDLELHCLGVEGADNLAITRAEFRAGRGEAQGALFVELTNFSAEAAAAKTVVSYGGTANQKVAWDLPAGKRVARSLPAPAADAGGLITVRLDCSDALAADDAVHLLSYAPEPKEVLLVTSQPESAVRAALSAAVGDRLTVSGELPPEPPADAVVVLDGPRPDRLPSGPTLILAAAAATPFWRQTGELIEPVAAGWSPHPSLHGWEPSDVSIRRAGRLELTADADPMVWTSAGEPLIAAIDRPGRRVLLAGFRIEDTDLPLRPDLARWLWQSVQWLGGQPTPFQRSRTTVDLLRLPAATEVRRLQSPDQIEHSIPPGRSAAAVLSDAGVWRLNPTADGGGEAWLPANLVNAGESDLRMPLKMESAASPRPARRTGPWWSWLVGLALVLAIGEWPAYQHGWTE